MPSVSKAQRRAAAIALRAKRGEIPVSKLKGASLQMYRSMTAKQLEEFASTKEKRLPKRKGIAKRKGKGRGTKR